MTCAYAMITEEVDGKRYVKFGVTENITSRKAEVQVGSPLQITDVIWVDCGPSEFAYAVERAAHFEHREIWSSGEWFCWKSGEDAAQEAEIALGLIAERECGWKPNIHKESYPRKMFRPVTRKYRAAAIRAAAVGCNIGNADLSSVRVTYREKKS